MGEHVSPNADESSLRQREATFGNWSDRTPSGFRGRVDLEEAQRQASRPRADQRVTEQDRQVRAFSSTQFVGHISDAIRFNRNGDMLVTIQVPYQFKHLALPLADAMGLPLSWDVQLWEPYIEAKDGD